ncbi:MAG: 1-acyl-sn-glycerol-3-phosphate acyltransferase [Clostridia bacterium]|nr:1-acyl-sn-glycerol-3-phosphate acyltransferase [Clostridia bacterium]
MILLFQLFFSIILTVATVLPLGLVSTIADIWIPIVMFIGYFVLNFGLWFVYLFIAGRFVNMNKPIKKPQGLYVRIFRYGVKHLLNLTRVKVIKKNTELIEKNQNYVFVGNHKSNFDPIVLEAVFGRKTIMFVSKPENFKVPIAGRILHKCGCVALERDNAREAFKMFMYSAELVKNNNMSACIYPEGTRNKADGELPLLPFKSGAFRLAQLVNLPIAVVTLKHTGDIVKNLPWKSTKVELNVVKIIPASEVQSKNTTQLSDEVKQIIETSLSE